MNTPKQHTYVPRCIAREKKFPSGGSVLSLSFHAESLAQFIREHTNARGYVNLTVTRRREIGRHDETHSVYLDTWEPTKGTQDMRRAVQQAEQQPEMPAQPQEEVPF